MARALAILCGFRLANPRWVYLGPFIDGIYVTSLENTTWI